MGVAVPDHDTDYQTLAASLGYQPIPQYAEWVVVGNTGNRPCRFSNWLPEDLESYVGGKYTIGYPKETE